MKKVNFKRVSLLMMVLGLTISSSSCKKETETDKTEKTVLGSKLAGITPQEFPSNLKVEGFKFPEDSTAIYSWLDKKDTVSIARHGWGIWTGLTQQSGQIYQGDSLRVFETWLGVKEIAQLCADGNSQGGCNVVKKQRTQLSVPKQFIHGQLFMNKGRGTVAVDTTYKVFETVSYNPAASCHATENLLFNQSTINKYQVKNGIGKIPDFPSEAITTKPVYYAGKADANGLIRVPVWPGNPVPAKAFKYDAWKTYVYADTKNRVPSGKKLTPVNAEKPSQSQIAAATCNLDDFIHYKIDAQMAKYLNEHEDKGNQDFKVGDMVMLVAMHVGTREINNWTWQSYFWSYNADSPFFPSSSYEANLRPSALKGAPRHYAMTTSYAMVWPNQPITGGSNKNVKPLISFNPYLEGGFGPGVFSVKNTLNPKFQYGVQTNCMTCHALATTATTTGYATDMYIDMKDKNIFYNGVQGDFSWSLLDNLNTNK